MEEKNWFLLARKSVSNNSNFSKIGFPLWFSLAEKKFPIKWMLFQLDRKSVSISMNGEFV